MKELLNKLIEKGWKPFGKEYDRFNVEGSLDMCFRARYPYLNGDNVYDYYYEYFLMRQLVSIESGLWQFVCENGMVGRGDRITKKKKVNSDGLSGEEVIYYSVIGSYNETDYQYRLIESALIDEDNLEQFLLDNIKIDEN